MNFQKVLRTTIIGASFAAIAATGASAKSLVYCSEGSPEGFDPALYTSGTTFDASSKPIYNRLVEFKRGTTEVLPGLAREWDISEDGLEYTFKLRQGVKFQTTNFFTPTRDFNADDVMFSFERQFKKRHAWHTYVPGASWEFFNGLSMPDLISEIVKVDDYTVKIVLKRPAAPVIASLAMDFASIVSAEYAAGLEKAGKKQLLNQQPVGTGPFAFVDYQKDNVIQYKSHAGYWNGKEKIDNLIFAITPDATDRLQKLKTGDCHVMPYPAPGDIANIRADKSLTLMEQQGLNVGYLAYNTQVAPFDNKEVRKALNHAINKQAILDAVFQGAGQVAKTPIPPSMWAFNDAVEDDEYNPDLAREMLEAAGVSDLSMKIWAMPVQRPYNPNANLTAELIQADFKKIGVDVEIVSFNWGEYLSRSKKLKRDGAVLLGGTSDTGDPDSLLAVLLGCDSVGGANRAQWCNDDFEALIQKAKTVTDNAEREKLYEEAQVVFKEEAPWATIAHSVVFMPMSSKVRGYVVDPLGGHWFDGVDIAE